MNFIVDAQMPPACAVWLRSRGHEAVHLNELGLKNAGDGDIWMLALERQSVVITKDRDFSDRVNAGSRPAPRVVWIRTGNLTRDQQVQHLTRNWLRILTRLHESTVMVIEVR